MARYPGAVWRPLPEQGSAPALTATQMVLHTVVGERSPYGTFNSPGNGKESHLWVGREAVEQYVDTARRADAQWAGNAHAISVETADNGHPDRDPWTPWQVEQLAQIAAWCHREHGVPLRACRTWDDPGLGFHRQFPEWNKSNHSCPGDARVAQVPQIIARAIEIVSGAPTPQEDDMPLTDADVQRIADAVWSKALASGVVPGQYAQPAGTLLALTASNAAHGRTAAQAAAAGSGALAGQVAAIAKGGGITPDQAEAAAEAGARKVLAEVADALTPDQH